MKRTATAISLAIALCGTLAAGAAFSSSHREAPLITKTPKVDNTDFYMFRSYESGRAGYVTFLANFQPLQDAYGGPNYFLMDPSALYGIHIDNDGDAQPDLSFYFRFRTTNRNLTVPAGGMDIPIPLSNIGSFGAGVIPDGNQNVYETFTVVTSNKSNRDRKFRNARSLSLLKNLSDGGTQFNKPFDNIGNKSISDYAGYADRFVHDVAMTGCATPGRVFVGQRNDGFSVNLGEVFDLVNTNPVGPPDGERNIIADSNITTIAVELPISCLTSAGSPIIGAWSDAYLPDKFGRMSQVSRLSAPLVNEVVIGLPDKDRFNASIPYDDGQFAKYVTNPSLPILLQALFGVQAPTLYPRTDLVAAFLTGLEGLNKPANVRPAEMMRLNTAIAPKSAVDQSNLGALTGDVAGFPNGRRPGDDVVDIALRVVMGALLDKADAPSNDLPYTDGATVKATDFRNTFPYLNTPVPGSPSN